MTTPTLSAWQGVTPIFLGNPSYSVRNNDGSTKTYKSEPSGLTIYTDNSGTKWIFMVSDNGILAKASLPASGTPSAQLTWLIDQTPDDKDKNYDYESVACAGGAVMVGVEGDQSSSTTVTPPVVKRFDPTLTSTTSPAGAFSGNEWPLSGIDFGAVKNKGMEALTMIPYDHYPKAWTNETAPALGGLFFVAAQAVFGKVYVYQLDPSSTATARIPVSLKNLGSYATNPLNLPTLTSAPTGSKPLVSDLCFANGTTYVLYDGGTDANNVDLTHDYFQVLLLSTLNNATADNAWVAQGDYELPWLDCEGLAIDGNNMYIAVDSGSNPSQDGIYVLPGVLSKLT